MHSEQPLPRALQRASAPSRPAPEFGRAAGLYGEVVTLPVSQREMATTAERKASL